MNLKYFVKLANDGVERDESFLSFLNLNFWEINPLRRIRKIDLKMVSLVSVFISTT